MNQESSEILSSGDQNQFQFSLSDKIISTQPMAAYKSSVTEPLKSLSFVQEAKRAKTRKGFPNARYYMSSTHSNLNEAEAFVTFLTKLYSLDIVSTYLDNIIDFQPDDSST